MCLNIKVYNDKPHLPIEERLNRLMTHSRTQIEETPLTLYFHIFHVSKLKF